MQTGRELGVKAIAKMPFMQAWRPVSDTLATTSHWGKGYSPGPVGEWLLIVASVKSITKEVYGVGYWLPWLPVVCMEEADLQTAHQ